MVKRKAHKDLTQNKRWNAIEDFIFFEAHKTIGNKWSLINKYLINR